MARERSASSRRCGWTHDGDVCRKAGPHFCGPRAEHVESFFSEALVHTKGRFARRRFDLAPWQRDDLVRPLFATVVWDGDLGRYVRRYRLAWMELARKNGKSELLAGIALYLLCADDEEGAEIYGAAKDRDQARKVFDVAMRMVQLSPVLSKAVTVKAHEKRLIYERTGSYYEVVAADAAGNLGHNPHGIIFDEILTQPSADLWNALRTAMGTREQPLMVAATTAGDDPSSFAALEHGYCERVQRDPALDPRRFVLLRNTPAEADPFDEANWPHANPALGDFLSVQALRDEALEAKNEPAKENAFRQFRLNQWVQQSTRWMPLHLYDASAGMVDEARLVGRECYGGLDLAAVSDLTSLCWVFPDGGSLDVVWRHFVPEAIVPALDKHTGDRFSVWVKQGFVEVTEGDVVDYGALHARILADARTFAPVSVGIDRWNSTGTVNWLHETLPKVSAHLVGQGFMGISAPMKEIMRLVRAQGFRHGGNPVARWCFDSVEVRQDPAENIKPIKPDRQKSGKRIDAVASAADAMDAFMRRPQLPEVFVPRRIS